MKTLPLCSVGHVTNFRERFCAVQDCRDEQFVRRVLWYCLHRHALPVARVFSLLDRSYFDADLEVIAQAGQSQTLAQIEEELRNFVHDSRNMRWWRRTGRVRISTHRLRELARRCFSATSPAAGAKPIPA